MKISEPEINEFAMLEANNSRFLSSYPFDQHSVEYGVAKGAKWAITKNQQNWEDISTPLSEIIVDHLNSVGHNLGVDIARLIAQVIRIDAPKINKIIMNLTPEQQEQHEKWGWEFDENGERCTVLTNMMKDKHYTPYCIPCPGLQRFGQFNGSHMVCPNCKTVTKFPKDFIDRYKAKHNL